MFVCACHGRGCAHGDTENSPDAAMTRVELLQFLERIVANDIGVEDEQLIGAPFEKNISVVVQATGGIERERGGGRMSVSEGGERRRESARLTRRYREIGIRGGT